MTNLRELNSAVQNSTYPGHEFAQAVREWIAAATERMEPESESAKVETTADRIAADLNAGTFRGVSAFPVGNCPTCGELVAPWNKHAKYEGGYSCEISELDDRHNRMASPEYQAKFKDDMDRRAVEIGGDRLVGVSYRPVSETVAVGTWQLEELLKYADIAEVALRTGFHPPEFLFRPADRSLRQIIDAVKKQRDEQRTHAQPVGDGDLAEMFHRGFVAGEKNAHAQPRPKLEKTRRALKCGQERLNIIFLSEETTTRWSNLFYEALAELDAAEGGGES